MKHEARQASSGLRNPNRRRILEQIQANPGSCLQELADALQLTRTAITHHLRALTDMGLVGSVRQGRRVQLFPREIRQGADRSILGLLRQESARTVLEALYANPTQSFRRVAAQLGMSPHSVRWHVARLVREGLIHVLPRHGSLRDHVVHFHPTVRMSLAQIASEPMVPTDASQPSAEIIEPRVQLGILP